MMDPCSPTKANNTEALRMLRIIKSNGGITRQKLAECLECSSAKISMLVNELDELGFVEEGEASEGGSGRKVRQIVISGRPARFIGVELGSYEIRVVLYDFGGKYYDREKILEDINLDSPEHVIKRLFDLLNRFIERNAALMSDVKGIALALSGVVDFADGTVRYFRNQKIWEGIQLKNIIEEQYKMPVFIDDSSRAMASAERRWGCCKDADYFVLFSLGVGLGTGVFIKDSIFRGNGYASDIGHMVIDPNGPRCNCGNHGCLESYASGYALESRVKRAIDKGVYTSLKIDRITAKDIITEAERGDKFAFSVVSDMAEKLGIGIANIINIFNPTKIVLAGGLSRAGELLLQPIKHVVRSTALSTHAQGCEIIISCLDEYSAAAGMTDLFITWLLSSAQRIKRVTGITV